MSNIDPFEANRRYVMSAPANHLRSTRYRHAKNYMNSCLRIYAARQRRKAMLWKLLKPFKAIVGAL